jgi:glutamine synthetase
MTELQYKALFEQLVGSFNNNHSNSIHEQLKNQSARASEIFGQKVLTRSKLNHYLSHSARQELTNFENGSPLSRPAADEIANAMMRWALENGATHYTHWFQPLTGMTAEKHEAFFTYDNGIASENFSGSELIQQEPDASSFPSGGIRSTFEARGYTAWDTTSPPFIYEKTLCIPSIFISYTGEMLDFKGPLLRTLALIDKAATAICRLFDPKVNHVTATLGIEQEYFLIDKSLYAARPDLIMSNRTLFGAPPARGQQLEDHYFGSIPVRIQAFMADFEIEAWKLGIPLKTRHNEVAPGQFECAPHFEPLNIAVDHNQLLMDLMQRVAGRHNLKVLFHEKPYAGVNGSGKHNNWSLMTDTGKNLFSPGKQPGEYLQFLCFLVCTLSAIYEHADLLRASVANAGNDHRLGANEAPPAIISVFLGAELSRVLDEVEISGNTEIIAGKTPMHLAVENIPDIQRDNTDRNRTSPFAFTGNKFEFRAVGSSANCAGPMTILNAIVADKLIAFRKAVDEQVSTGKSTEAAIVAVLQQYIHESKPIRFEGNGYSQAWKIEAAKRGLPHLTTTPEAIKVWTNLKNIELFTRHNLFTARELHARQEILFEQYVKQLQIEGRIYGELIMGQIIPAAIQWQQQLIKNIELLSDLKYKKETYKSQLAWIEEISEINESLYQAVHEMTQARAAANEIEDMEKRAIAYTTTVRPHFEKLRKLTDRLEMIVKDEYWPFPHYREMLFLH